MRCVLLSGGGGTRLWPLSVPERPKQFLRLPGGDTLFNETIRRNVSLADDIMVVANQGCRELVRDSLAQMGMADHAQVVLEPCPRNTAPAVAMTALLAPGNEVILVVPTDHHIEGQEAYAAAVWQAEQLAREGSLVVFGIQPTSPHTGYGYIQHEGSKVLSFREKPDLATAQRYLTDGGYLWNSGMLAFRAEVMLDELRTHCPDILAACERVASEVHWDAHTALLNQEQFARVRAESIDYAVMERSQRVSVVPARFGWSDLGSLDSFGVLAQKDAAGNRVLGQRTVVHGSTHTSVYNASQSMTVVANGLDDVIVTVTDEAVYVTRTGSADEIRELGSWTKGEG